MALTNTRGIFALFDVRIRQNTGIWNTSLGGTLGYFGGGNIGGSPSVSVTTVDRVDYSNDTATASIKGPLTVARDTLAGVGNNYYGWYIGGTSNLSPSVTTIDRIDYSNDTATAIFRSNSASLEQTHGGVGNENYGYFIIRTISNIYRIDYLNDTAGVVAKGPLSLARNFLAATGNSSYGYFGGGVLSAVDRSTVDRIDYSNDTPTASPRGPLSLDRYSLAATGNSSYGYFGGGKSGSPDRSTVDRIDYSNDTPTASPKGPLSQAKKDHVATGNSSFGYFSGANNSTSLDRIDYSNDTATASVRGSLSDSRTGCAANSAGQYELSATATFIRRSETNVVDQKSAINYGYFGGGLGPGGGGTIPFSSIYRIDYTNDTKIVPVRGPLSIGRKSLAATGNGSYGYFGGGWFAPSTSYSTVDRIDYLSDTVSAVTRGPLSAARRYLAATGNSSYGYFGGGYGPSNFIEFNDVYRIDYSNDTPTAPGKGPLSLSRGDFAATGNSSYGYFGGGSSVSPAPIRTWHSTVDRIDYSNDTPTAPAKGPLTNARNSLAATGNSSYGYFGGGNAGGTGRSYVERIDYSNDTPTAPAKGQLSNAQIQISATGNQNYGYFVFRQTSVDRIDYANDTATASARSILPNTYPSTEYTAACSAAANGLPQ